MVLDHVTHCAGFFVIAASSLDAKRLSDGNLHVINVRVVPQRLEKDVGETQRHEVLHRFLAKIVVDAKNVSFKKDRTNHVVDGRGASAVSADRFLDDNS